MQCLGTTTNSREPYGFDPMYLPTSTLYDRTLNASAYYKDDEISPTGFPYGALEQRLPKVDYEK